MRLPAEGEQVVMFYPYQKEGDSLPASDKVYQDHDEGDSGSSPERQFNRSIVSSLLPLTTQYPLPSSHDTHHPDHPPAV